MPTTAKTGSSGFDYSGIDVSKVKAGSISLGTDQQDCALIARTFETAAHSTPIEAAVWAPFARILANNKTFSLQASSSISDYIKAPQMAALKLQGQVGQMSASSGMGVQNTSPGSGSVDELMSGVGFGGYRTQMSGASKFGETMSAYAMKCLPCSPLQALPKPGELLDSAKPPKPGDVGRLTSFIQLNPSIAIMKVLEQDIKDKLAVLFSVVDLFSKPPTTDMCGLIKALDPICILDLQRMIAMLMARIMFDVPALNGMLDLLGQLVGAIFAPILQSVNSLIDMFIQLITAPLRCVVSAIEAVDANLSEGVASSSSAQLSSAVGDASSDVQKTLKKTTDAALTQSGLKELTKSIESAKKSLEELAEFYTSELKALIGDQNGGDANYLNFAMKKLTQIRQIMMIVAMIRAKLAGHAACNRPKGATPDKDALNSFFKTYINPESPFETWIDANGQMHVAEKGTTAALTTGGGSKTTALPKPENVLKFEGGGTSIDPTVATTTENIATALSKPVEIITKCQFDTTQQQAEQINKWIEELNA